MIFFKTNEEQREFDRLDNRLRILLFAISGIILFEKKYQIVITDCLRSIEEDEKYGGVGIHPTGRALDFNFCDIDLDRIQDDEYAANIMDRINSLVPYGVEKFNTIIHHDIGHGNHFHLQVNNTGKTSIINV